MYIKIDIGMYCLGLEFNFKSIEIIKKICVLKGLEIEGIFMYLSNVDVKIKIYVKN